MRAIGLRGAAQPFNGFDPELLSVGPDELRELGRHPRFHALGVHILREQFQRAGLLKTFTIFDRDDSKKAVKEALVARGYDPKTNDPGKIMNIISREKGRGTTADEFLETSDTRGYVANMVAEIWPEYERALKRDNALDFDDLLLKATKLMMVGK